MMMRASRVATIALSVLAAACAADDTTAPKAGDAFDVRLAAIAADPVAAVGNATVSMQVTVVSSLPEAVSGGECANLIEARLPNASSWTNVTAAEGVCSTRALLLSPGATAAITATGSQSAIRAMANGAGSVVLRARHTLSGATATYTLQTNEVTLQLQ